MKNQKDKQIRELNSILVFFMVLFLLTGIFMMVFLVMWVNTELELQSYQDKVPEKIKCLQDVQEVDGINISVYRVFPIDFEEPYYYEIIKESEYCEVIS